MIRLIVALLYVVLGMTLCLPYHLYLWILSKKNPEKSWEKSGNIARGFFKILLKITGTRITVKGLEKLDSIPKDQGILFIGNHRSYFDIIILSSIINRPLGFIAKKEFKKVPVFSWWVADIGSLFLDRKNIRAGLETINLGTENMKKGLSLGLYPEGTRNHTDVLLPFKTGGYRMAEKSESPMVLVAMTGTDDILENNKPARVKKCDVTVQFDTPVYPHSLEAKERKSFYNQIPDKLKFMLDEASH